ncbi:MAG: DUF1501 domain-containing protein [Pseudomonadales bacterium]|nr:DUF1501 domain-containing protein [Pseudomonadales bacterium]
MKRRRFLKYMAGSSVVMGSSPFLLQKAYAANPDHFFVHVHANGAWDTTSLCDPKGDQVFYDEDQSRGPINLYKTSDIRRAGNITFAPYHSGVENPDGDIMGDFFNRHKNRLMVINGVDHGSNNHRDGGRIGRRGNASAGMPDFGALLASNYGQDLAMPLIGAAYTGGLTTVTSPDAITKMTALTQGNKVYNRGTLMPDDLFDQIQNFAANELEQRYYAEDQAQHLAAMDILKNSRANMDDLNRVISYLPTTPSSGLNGAMENIAAAFASGISAFASIGNGQFDHHDNLHQRFTESINTYLAGIDHLWSELERHGISDRTTVIMCSDFGRTPWMNNRAGKDHWAVGSWMLMGKGIRGNQVIGSTTKQLKANKLDPNTLEVDNDNGALITGAMVHQSLRELAGLRGSVLDNSFPLNSDFVDLLV